MYIIMNVGKATKANAKQSIMLKLLFLYGRNNVNNKEIITGNGIVISHLKALGCTMNPTNNTTRNNKYSPAK